MQYESPPLDQHDFEMWLQQSLDLVHAVMLVSFECPSLTPQPGFQVMHVRFGHEWVEPPEAAAVWCREQQGAAGHNDSAQLPDAGLFNAGGHVFQHLTEDDAVEEAIMKRECVGAGRQEADRPSAFATALKRQEVEVDPNAQVCGLRERSQTRAIVAPDVEHAVQGSGQVLVHPAGPLVQQRRGGPRFRLQRFYAAWPTRS